MPSDANQNPRNCSVEVAENLSSGVLLSGLLVIHDTLVGGEDEVSEETRGQQVLNPSLDLIEADIETRGDDSALVDAAVELDDNLARAAIVNNLELTNVSCEHQSS